jgi:hypothetical protein
MVLHLLVFFAFHAFLRNQNRLFWGSSCKSQKQSPSTVKVV